MDQASPREDRGAQAAGPHKKVKVKAGTQVIDRRWRHIKSFLEGRSNKVGSIFLKKHVRFAQWVYRNRDKDLWAECARVVSSQ